MKITNPEGEIYFGGGQITVNGHQKTLNFVYCKRAYRNEFIYVLILRTEQRNPFFQLLLESLTGCSITEMAFKIPLIHKIHWGKLGPLVPLFNIYLKRVWRIKWGENYHLA